MNIKQKSLFILSLVFTGSALVGALVTPAEPAMALTKKEWQQCRKDYHDIVYAPGVTEAQVKKWNKFKKSKCYVDQGGNCGIITEGSGSFQNYRADCPISDKYLKEKEKSEEDTEESGGEDTGDGTTLTDPGAGNDCAGVETSIITCDAKNSGDVSDNGMWALLMIAINIMTAGVGVLAVAGIVYGAILYTTAEDKADQVKKATDIITNVVIGLIMFGLMWAGLNFLIPGGVFAT